MAAHTPQAINLRLIKSPVLSFPVTRFTLPVASTRGVYVLAIKRNYKNITETRLENVSTALNLQLIELSVRQRFAIYANHGAPGERE